MRIPILATIVFAVSLSSNAAKEIIVNGQRGCEPVCACYMDGIYYDEGDTFQKIGEPCVTYTCKKGFYEATEQGCEYKGKCKALNTEWMDECMKYKCVFEAGRLVYRQIDGGCQDKFMNCIAVGQRVEEDCHVQECQIDGSCYNLASISKGCQFEKTCKPLNSYWHNGCTIYGCVEDKGNPFFKVLEDEIMYWPKGHYSLLMPKEGCPSDLEHKWRNSSVMHFGDGKNFVSTEFDLFGNYTEIYFDHHFCTHIEPEEEDLSFIPRYQTYWDQGEYCILRKNSNCPEGFESGVVKFDDKDLGVTLNLTKYAEWLPDGFFMVDTVFAFCCRSDGLARDPIVLPKEHPFVLFMASGANECQEVRGMSHELEFFYFDNAETGGKPEKIGAVPEIKDDDNNTLLYFCYYKPFECGCRGDNGKIIELDTNFTRACILYKCIKFEGKPYLDVLKGGCFVNGKCVNENSTWIENAGEKCVVKTCSRVMNAVKGYQFEVKTKYKGSSNFKENGTYRIFYELSPTALTGCKDDNECRPIGYQKSRGCYGMVCSTYGRLKEPYFRLKKQGCSNGNGGCINLGEIFKRGCITYRCRKEPNRCDLELISGGCNYNGKCHDVNSTWEIGCATGKCSMIKKEKSFLLKMERVSQKCDFKGKCYKVGETANYGCNKYICIKLNDTNFIMDIKKGGCLIENKCRDVNSTWNEGCVTFSCKWEKKDNHHIFKKSIASLRCPWKNKCYEPDEIVTDNCISHKCIYKVEKNSYSAQMKETSAACEDKTDGTCVTLGEAVEKNCIKYNCTRPHNSYPYLKPIGRGCKVNGVCLQMGTKWTDKKQCADFECKQHPKYPIPFPQRVKAGCKINGVCKSVNESEENGCYKQICKEFKKNGKMYTGVEKRPNGCMEKDVCRPFGYIRESGCFKYVCSEHNFKLLSAGCQGRDGKCYGEGVNWKYSDPKYSTCMEYQCKKQGYYYRNVPVKYSCMGQDKKCHEIDDLWVHKLTEYASCVYYKCKKQGNYYRNVAEKYGCLDSSGNCRKVGEKGFEVKTPKFTMKNCHCKGFGQRVRVECKG